MSVPKQRHTNGRSDRKRKRFKLTAKKMQKCPKCGASIMPHRACAKCGYYKGKEVVNTLKRVQRKKKK